jgi:hypothetical protein
VARFDPRSLSETGDRKRFLAISQVLEHAGFAPRLEVRTDGVALVANAGRSNPTDLYFFSDVLDHDRLADILEAFADQEEVA